MKVFLTALGLWGVGDSLWLAIRPRSWADWWGRWIDQIGDKPLAARLVAAAEIGLILALATWIYQSEVAPRSESAVPGATVSRQ